MRAPSFAPLRNPEFLKFWLTRAIATFGFQIQATTIGWQVYAIARDSGRSEGDSAFLLGLVGLIQFVPLLLLSPIGGQAADRWSRKGILILYFAGKAATLIFLVLASNVGGESALTLIFAAAAISGGLSAFAPAASQALMPMLVPRQQLPEAVALSSLAFSTASIVGPALAGGLIWYGQSLGGLGAHVAYGGGALFFTIALVLCAAINAPKQERLENPQALRLILEGLVYVRRNKIVLGAISLDLVAVLLAGATALLPVFARDILDLGGMNWEVALGLMRSAVAAGAAITALALAIAPLRRRVGPWMLFSVAVFGAATVAFGLSTTLWAALAALFVIGASDMVSVNVRSSLVQLATPDAMRGRVASTSFIFISASNELGDFQSGVAARVLTPIGAVLFGGVGAIATAALWVKLFPELWRLDSFEDAARYAER